MTKAELIIKFSKNADVIENDSKAFFELILKKIANNLRSGQSLFIHGFGYFHLIKGKIKKPVSDVDDAENYEELIDVILFSEQEKLSESEAKGFVFNVPADQTDNYDPVDSYFSLSIGKPLIPLRGVLGADIYIPTSGQDYRRLLESKADNLVLQSKIISSEEQFPMLIIDASSYNSSQVHLEIDGNNLDEILSDYADTKNDSNDIPDEKIVKNIAWDFGKKLSDKISAQSILELTDEKLNEQHKESEIKNTEKSVPDPLSDENEIILDKLLESDEEEKNIKTSSDGQKKGEENLLDDFEEVKSEFNNDKLDDDISDEEFWKDASKLFEAYSLKIHSDKEDDEFIEVKSSSEKFSETNSNEDNFFITEDENEINKSDQNKNYVKRRTGLYAFVTLFVLVILAATSFYWYNNLGTKNVKNVPVNFSLSSKNTNIIARDFKIPITFPYLINDTSSLDDSNKVENFIQAEKSNNSDLQQKLNKIKNESNGQTEIIKEITSGSPAINMGNNIYKYGNNYVVQVASFRSNSIALNEAGKYKNKGFNAFVEQIELPQKGLWYRVRVGNFLSLDEAKNFISKNLR